LRACGQSRRPCDSGHTSMANVVCMLCRSYKHLPGSPGSSHHPSFSRNILVSHTQDPLPEVRAMAARAMGSLMQVRGWAVWVFRHMTVGVL
jgi:hypothetical protein